MKYIYLIESLEDNTYKIGFSKNPEKRLKEIQTGNSNKLSIKHLFQSKYPTKLEAALHNRYNLENKRGEWFVLTEEQIDSFQEQCEKIERGIVFLKENGNIFI